jgi:hypothetical protein
MLKYTLFILKVLRFISNYFVYSESILWILKAFRVFHLFLKHFVYSQSILFILNLPAFHSHPNINPSVMFFIV